MFKEIRYYYERVVNFFRNKFFNTTELSGEEINSVDDVNKDDTVLKIQEVCNNNLPNEESKKEQDVVLESDSKADELERWLDYADEPAAKRKKINTSVVLLDELIDKAKSSEHGANIYFVNMNAWDMKSNSANTSHSRRPFIALKDEDDGQIQGLYTTSYLKNGEFRCTSLYKYRTVLSDKRYNLKKPSLVDLTNTANIRDDNIQFYIDTLQDDDLIRNLKMKNLVKSRTVLLDAKYLTIGNVIKMNSSLYMIYQKDNSYIYGYRIEKCGKVKNSRIDLENTTKFFAYYGDVYSIDFNDRITLTNNDEVALCDNITDDCVDFCLALKKKAKYLAKTKK